MQKNNNKKVCHLFIWADRLNACEAAWKTCLCCRRSHNSTVWPSLSVAARSQALGLRPAITEYTFALSQESAHTEQINEWICISANWDAICDAAKRPMKIWWFQIRFFIAGVPENWSGYGKANLSYSSAQWKNEGRIQIQNCFSPLLSGVEWSREEMEWGLD